MPTIQESVNQIKLILEQAIRTDGESGKLSLIRSQKPIKLIHEAVKSELIANQITPTSIRPLSGVSEGEVTLSGFLKKKSQDIVVFPSGIDPIEEIIESGFLEGKIDNFGNSFTERVLSINVRSQLSSLAKNFDTLYERTFAEALNFHLRCPNMCLGEVYMIPVYEYDTRNAQDNIISFSRGFGNVEKYLLAFNAIAGRITTTSDLYKYEQVCLLIVDFSKDVPKIYSSDEELKRDGLLSQDSTTSIANLTFDRFIPSLLETYRARFPNLI